MTGIGIIGDSPTYQGGLGAQRIIDAFKCAGHDTLNIGVNGLTGRGIAVLALLAVLAGCGDGINTGYITKRTYTPAHDDMHFQCAAYDARGICTVQMPVWDHYDAEWRFDLREGDKTGWVTVDEKTFGRYDVGAHYPDPR